MRTRFMPSIQANRWLPAIAVLLMFVAGSAALGACGGGGEDQALVDKSYQYWRDNNFAGAREIYATDAVIYLPEGNQPARLSGIEQITNNVSFSLVDPIAVGGATLSYTPSTEDLKNLSLQYGGARFIASPTRIGSDLYMAVYEIRDGKIANQWLTYIKP